ncbi:MAG: helix-turn-helix domain-containing protein [Porphyrobacter sp.]|nr:helix-turn-helix domain-containing protein [Porphyrobacter sp.]
MIEHDGDQNDPGPAGIGARLRAERERQGLTLQDVAAQTRIALRHLATIEDGAFASLPGRTYATGFARNYAKVVGLDPDMVAAQVAAEMAAQPQTGERGGASFQPGDPARVPSAGLTWLALAAVVLLLLGGFFFMRTLFAPAAQLPSLIEQQEQEAAAARAAQAQRAAAGPAAADRPQPAGPVVFTALEDGIWVKFYDSTGRQLMQKHMARGERYTVPADAEGPLLWTGRPDALAISVGGRELPPLAREQRIMRDVPVTAQALLARGEDAAAGPASASPGGASPGPA